MYNVAKSALMAGLLGKRTAKTFAAKLVVSGWLARLYSLRDSTRGQLCDMLTSVYNSYVVQHYTCNCSSIWLTESCPGATLAAAKAENNRHPAARARPVLREGKKREAIANKLAKRMC